MEIHRKKMPPSFSLLANNESEWTYKPDDSDQIKAESPNQQQDANGETI